MGDARNLIREETALEAQAKNAVFWDDTDLLVSPIDGRLVVVAMKHGVHSCQGCGNHVNFSNGIEVHMGGTRLLMHPKCRERKPRSFFSFKNLMDIVNGQIFRRNLAKAAKATDGVAKAAEDSKSRIIS